MYLRVNRCVVLRWPPLHFRHPRRLFTTSSSCFNNPFFCRGFLFQNPFLFYPPLFGPEAQYAQQPYPVSQQTYDDTALRNQVQRLADEVERLREEQKEVRQAPQQSPRSAAEQAPPLTILVFHDSHRREVQNYAIVDQTLWVFADHHPQKYLLSDLDLSATKAANEERGVEFSLPCR